MNQNSGWNSLRASQSKNEEYLLTREQNNFSCPGCKQYVYFSDFGIDFGLYHILAEKQILEQTGQKLMGNKIIYSLNNGKTTYYAISKLDKKTKLKIPGTYPIFRLSISKNNLNIKNLINSQVFIRDGATSDTTSLGVVPTKVSDIEIEEASQAFYKYEAQAGPCGMELEIPLQPNIESNQGSNPLEILPGYHQGISINSRQQDILEQMNYTIQKMKDYLCYKLHQGKLKGLQINQMKQILKGKIEQLKTTFKKSLNLVELGVKSLETQFIFGLKKLYKDGQNAGSVLVVYYPHLGVWQDYKIKTTPEKHFQYEYQLYAKEQGQEKENIVYVIGGRVKNLEATNIFVRIRFPKDPFTLEKQVSVDYLPNLPNAAFNYLGGCYNNNVSIFCGQRRTTDQSGRVVDTIFDVGYTFKNGKWNKLNEKVEKRYDGSCTIINHVKYDKCLILYGGIEELLDGRVGCHVQQQQHIVQVFQFKQEKFLGNGFKLKFSDKLEDNYQKYMLSSPIFSIPYGTHSELLIAGEFLKTNWKEGREVYIFDWQDGTIKINQVQSQPLEYFLLSHIQRNYSYSVPEFLQPVQDIEGAFVFGNYYTIHQEELQLDSRTTIQNFQLFEYKAASGQVSTRSFLQREISIKQAIEALQNLPNQENKNL